MEVFTVCTVSESQLVLHIYLFTDTTYARVIMKVIALASKIPHPTLFLFFAVLIRGTYVIMSYQR